MNDIKYAIEMIFDSEMIDYVMEDDISNMVNELKRIVDHDCPQNS